MEPQKLVCVNLRLTPEIHEKFKAYCISQNRSMKGQVRFMVERLLDPSRPAPVTPLPLAKSAPLAKTEVLRPRTEADVRRIVRHELSYRMPDQYERRYGKGDPL